MSLPFFRLTVFARRQLLRHNGPLSSRQIPFGTRTYASVKKQAKSTSNLVPGSRQPITDPAAQEEYSKAESAMKAAVDWYGKDCAMLESRASGRVTPALLSPVRVKLPDVDSEMRLEEVATVGIREGSMLLVTAFEENVNNHFSFILISTHLRLSRP